MLVLFETPAGYAIFKLLDENKLEETENLYLDFESPEAVSKVLKLKHFEKFADTSEALAATTAAVEGKLCKSLKKTLKKHCAGIEESLAVADAKLGSVIKDKLSLSCVSNTSIQELMRCIRTQLDCLLAGVPKKELTAMALGLAHSLSRYKLKFSPDKIDTMIIQAVCLLDDLDKELNNYIMRTREWYGWHFPELGKIVTDNVAFVKTVQIIGTRDNASKSDLSDLLPEDIEERVKQAAELSMGTEISNDDIINIQYLCNQVIEISQYRTQLYDYLKTRMMAMAPNLTVLVGDLVGARLISHAGSLINLAKHPASTVQILGAEKALFRALKTKKDTPKYGLIYHSQLVGQSSTKNKGKMSRMLAAKASLATRVDALGEDGTFDLGVEHKIKLESRLKILEEGNLRRISGTGKAKAKFEKYHSTSEVFQYPTSADSTLKRRFSEAQEKKPIGEDLESPLPGPSDAKKKKKEFFKPDEEEEEIKVKSEEESEDETKKKKKKKIKKEVEDLQEAMQILECCETMHTKHAEVKEEPEEEAVSKKKKKKSKKEKESLEAESQEEEEGKMDVEESETTEIKKKKKKKQKSKAEEEAGTSSAVAEDSATEPTSEKKKKKKKKSKETV